MAKGTEARPREPALTTARRGEAGNRERAAVPTWALSPTDLTFLWDECRRCFYNKVVRRQPRPRGPFPKVFGAIDRAMKDFYLDERAEVLVPGMPSGVIGHGDRWAKSVPIGLPGRCSTGLIRGRIDALVSCDDGTTVVIDFKTSPAKDVDLGKYGRQMHAYGLALEQPAVGPPTVVSGLGLLSFSPERFETTARGAALIGGVTWTDVPVDRPGFMAFLNQVLAVLDQLEPPPPSETCWWCSPATKFLVA